MENKLTEAEILELSSEGEAGMEEEPFDGISFFELAYKYER